MQKLFYTLSILFTSITLSFSQVLKVDYGFIQTSFTNQMDLAILNKKVNNNALFLGFNYSSNKRISFSSQVGYFKIGGMDVTEIFNSEDYIATQETGFLNMNSVANFSLIEDRGIKFCIGAGPYVNFLMGDRSFDDPIYNGFYSFSKAHIGVRPDISLIAELGKIRLGVSGFYMLNLTPVATSAGLSLNSKVYGLSLSVGLKI